MNSSRQRKRISIVDERDLCSSSDACVDSGHAGVLLVHPGALDVGLLLRVETLRVNFASQVGDHVHALLLEGSVVVPSLFVEGLLELLLGLEGVGLPLLPEEVFIRGVEVSLVVRLSVTVNHSSKTTLSGLDRAIDEREFRDVVLIYHGLHGLLPRPVHRGVGQLCVLGRLQLPETVVRNESESFLLRLPFDATQGLREAGRGQTVQVLFLRPHKLLAGVHFVGLGDLQAVLVPILVQRLVLEVLHLY